MRRRYLGIALILFLSACGGSPQPTSTPAEPTQTNSPTLAPADIIQEQVVVVGSDTAAPVTSRIVTILSNGGIIGSVSNEITGSGPGIDRLCEVGDAQIAIATRPMTSDEQTACQGRMGKPLAFTIGLEAVGVFVSSQNTFLTDLTLDELRTAFSTARTWADVRAGWPADPIGILVEIDGSQFNFLLDKVFTTDIQPDFASPNFLPCADCTPQGRSTAVAASPSTITLLGLSALSDPTLRAIPIGGAVLTPDTVTAGTYPISRPVWLYTTDQYFQRPQINTFVNAYLEHLAEGVVGTDLALPNADALSANTQTLQSGVGS